MSKVRVNLEFRTKKKLKSFCKTVEELDPKQEGHKMFVGRFLDEGENYLEKDTLIIKVENFGNINFPSKSCYIGRINELGDIIWENNYKGYSYPYNICEIYRDCEKLLTL